MFTIAVVGHSNLPVFSCWEGVHVEIYKEKGASLNDLVERKKFGLDLFLKHWNCVILFLGGNDLNAHTDADTVYNLFVDACNNLQRLAVSDRH